MIFSRWTVVYKHDKQPVEECLFIHKSHAIKKHESMNNKDKCEIKQIALMNKEFAEFLTGKEI